PSDLDPSRNASACNPSAATPGRAPAIHTGRSMTQRRMRTVLVTCAGAWVATRCWSDVDKAKPHAEAIATTRTEVMFQVSRPRIAHAIQYDPDLFPDAPGSASKMTSKERVKKVCFIASPRAFLLRWRI